MRRVVAALVVVGLAIAVVLLWPRSDPEEPPIGEATTTSSTSTTEPSTTTSTTAATTSTTALEDDRTVETVEEAEEILRELWFGWFEGIYNQDEERIREVVGNPDQVASAVEQFEVMEFDAPPTASDLDVEDVEILRSDTECLALWGRISAQFRTGSIEGVHVFRARSNDWLLINTWPLRDDLWESDCDVVLS